MIKAVMIHVTGTDIESLGNHELAHRPSAGDLVELENVDNQAAFMR